MSRFSCGALLLAALPGLASAEDAPRDAAPRWAGFLQFRYDGVAGDEGAGVSSMRVRRARIKAVGEVGADFGYKLHFSLARSTGSLAVDPTLLDVELRVRLGSELNLVCGQFKVPVGHEEVQPAWRIDLLDYFRAGERLLSPTGGRDIGVKAFGALADDRLDWQLGVYNGAGPNVTANNDTGLLYAGALDWDASGAGGQALYLHASALWERPRGGDLSDPSAYVQSDLGMPFAGPYRRLIWDLAAGGSWGRWSAKTEYIAAELRADSDSDPRFDASGAFLQAGCELVDDKIEAFVRHQSYDPDDRSAPSAAAEIDWTTLAFNYYVDGHDAKLMANYVLKREADEAIDDDVIQLQFQLRF